MSKVTFSDRGAVRILRINRPEVHNCVDGETAVALAEGIGAFAADDALRVLVVAGTGERAFCSGADLKAAFTLLDHPYVDEAGPMGFARLDPGKPTVAAIEGYCFAGGFELAAWCDMRIAGDGAEFGCLSRRWGVPYTDGGTQRFARIIGLGNALYVLQTGVRIDARRAYQMGFLQEVVPAGTALERALDLAERIAAYPNQSGIRADRRAVLDGSGMGLDDGLLHEAAIVRPTLSDPDLAAGLDRFGSGDRTEAPRPLP
jgi:enoyl-CoA hydratase